VANFQSPRNDRTLSTITTPSTKPHHKNTTRKYHFSQNPLQKTPQKQTKIPLSGPHKKISEKTGLGLKNGLEK
jgi:hypothetical protein